MRLKFGVLKNCSFKTIEYSLKVEQNLTLIVVILHD
jgi:hypothetical protein